MTVATKIEAIRPGTSSELIAIYLPIADSIDECLSKYPELAEITKALLVAHYIEQSTTQGAITSESTRTGASASYKAISGEGLSSTRFGQQLLSLPTLSCVQSLVKNGRFARSINPCR